MVEPAYASLAVEPLSVLTHMMDEREIPHPAGGILSFGAPSPKRELPVLVTYLRGATLPHPTRLTSSLYHPSYHSSPVEPTLPTPAFLDAYWVVGLIIIYVITL